MEPSLQSGEGAPREPPGGDDRSDSREFKDLITRHHERLRRMIAIRLDPRLQGRVDPSDLLQEVYLDAAQQFAEHLRSPTVPEYLWLRSLTGTRLAKAHRFHLGTQARDAGRELSLFRMAGPAASSDALAAQLLGREPRPSEAVARAELKLRVAEALDGMEAMDREVLVLRHFELLTTPHVAEVLGITEAAAGKRYIRALRRLKEILSQFPGGPEALLP